MTPADELSSTLRARQPKAIHSALVILEEVARCGPGVTAREVSDNLALPRATAYRLLNLLVEDEYLVRLPDLSGFALGHKVAELAGAPARSGPPQAVRDIMDSLRAGIRGGVHLVMYDDVRLTVVDADPAFPLSNPARLTRYLDASAMGHLLVAELARAGRLPASVLEHPDANVAALAASLSSRGYSRQVGHFTPGYGCLAVPIRDRADRLVAGLCLSAPRPLIENPEPVLATLREQAGALAPLLA